MKYMTPCKSQEGQEETSFCLTHNRSVFKCTELLYELIEELRLDCYSNRVNINSKLFTMEEKVMHGDGRMFEP